MSKNAAIELASNSLEYLADSICSNEVVKEIPLFSPLVSVIQLGVSAKDYFFLKNFEAFLISTSNILHKEEILKFSQNKDSGKISKKLIQVVAQITDFEKAEILACLLAAKIDGEITTAELMRAVDLVQYTFIEDIIEFNYMIQVIECTFQDLVDYKIESLINTALIQPDKNSDTELRLSGRDDEVGVQKYSQSDFGYKFRNACKKGSRLRQDKA